MYAGTNTVLVTIQGYGFINTPELVVRVDENIIKPIFVDSQTL